MTAASCPQSGETALFADREVCVLSSPGPKSEGRWLAFPGCSESKTRRGDPALSRGGWSSIRKRVGLKVRVRDRGLIAESEIRHLNLRPESEILI